LFRHLVGEPAQIQAMAGNVEQAVPIEDFGMMHLAAGGTAFGEITGSYSLRVCGNWVEWYGSAGSARISYWNAGQPDLAYRVQGASDWTVVDVAGQPDRFAGEIDHFLACVRTGSRPLTGAADGVRANQIIDAAYESVRSGRRMSVPAA
jgi:predicted dehydrogenase